MMVAEEQEGQGPVEAAVEAAVNETIQEPVAPPTLLDNLLDVRTKLQEKMAILDDCITIVTNVSEVGTFNTKMAEFQKLRV